METKSAGDANPRAGAAVAVIALVVAVAFLVFGALVTRPDGVPVAQLEWRPDLATLLEGVALVAAAVALATKERRPRAWMHAIAGALVAPLLLVRAGAWLGATSAILIAIASVAALPSWRGLPRDLGAHARGALAFLAVALAVPLGLAMAAAIAGTLPALLGDLALAVPARPAFAAAVLATETLVVVLVLDAVDARRQPTQRAIVIERALVVASLAALAARASFIASVSGLRVEAFWSEAPFLVNALKLDAGEVLYGPPAELSSYTYSPLLDLAHHALLAPLGLELSLFANRALVLVDQALASLVLGLALWPLLRGAVVVVALAAFANLLAPAIHPDHPLLLCFAIAVALVVAEPRWPRALWWTALVLVTPVAVAFKVSGAGIGLGLGIAFLVERRWRVVAALAASAALAAATVPLFDATLGRFSFYALGVQASHPIMWSRLATLAMTPLGLAVLAMLALGVTTRRDGQRPLERDRHAARLLALTLGVGVASLPAYLKYGGRDNNLASLFTGVVIVLMLRARAARFPPSLGPALGLLACLLFRPLGPPLASAQRLAARADAERVVAAIREADASGSRALLLVQADPWIEAGHRDVPRDRLHSAVELYFGGRPEASQLFADIESGEYASIVVGATELRVGTDPRGEFNRRLRASIESRYEVAYPSGAAIDASEATLIWRLIAPAPGTTR